MVFSRKINITRQLSGSVIAVGLAASLMLAGCSKVDEPAPDEVETAEQSLAEQPSAEQAVIGQGRDDEPEDPEQHQPADGADTLIKPVSYDVQNWEASDKQLGIDDLDEIKSLFGKVTVTDENSLDYVSNTAIKYRFMTGEEPYLDIIDSDKYLELGWYYANPGDSDSEKEMSINHAKKVYKAATALMGEQGAQLVTSILSGQIVKNKEVGDKKVELAKCEFYSCMLILDKRG